MHSGPRTIESSRAPFHSHLMFIVLYWNCRGIGNTATKRMLHHLVSLHSPDIIFLSEPKTHFHSFSSISLHSFGFDSFLSNNQPPNVSTLWWKLLRFFPVPLRFYFSTHYFHLPALIPLLQAFMAPPTTELEEICGITLFKLHQLNVLGQLLVISMPFLWLRRNLACALLRPFQSGNSVTWFLQLA